MLLALSTSSGCDLFGGGSNTPEPPAKPEYERSFDEFSDVPHQMTVQVEWAAEPIDEAILLAQEIAQLRANVDLSAEDFEALFSVAFKDGTVELGAVTMAEDAKVQVEATLARVKEVGASLQGVPGRAKKAGQAISKLAMSSPKLALSSSKELTAELAVAVGDGGAQIEADLETVKALPAEVKAEAAAAKDVLAALPEKAKQAGDNLVAAFKGEPVEPMETTGGEGEGEGGAEVAAAGAGESSASAGASASGSASASASVSASVGTVEADTSPIADLPKDAIDARVKELQRMAIEAGERGDWLTAADAFEEAYVFTPDNLVLAYKAGEASNLAHDCARAAIYYERFVEYGDQSLFGAEIVMAKEALGELKTFECAPRTSDDEAARAATLALRAEALGEEDDWGGAAARYAEAYQLAPEEHSYAYYVAVASWNGRECEDATTYFNHFKSVADPSAHRRLLKETANYIEMASASMCPVWAEGEKDAHARELYKQAQALEAELDFLAAIDKYERAYYQLPNSHALAFRIGESAWRAQLCEKAAENYRTFVQKIDTSDSMYASDLSRANELLARVDGLGCPNALYSSSAPPPDEGKKRRGGKAGGAGDEKPPSSKMSCSVHDDSPPSPAALGLLMLALVGIRRRRSGASGSPNAA